MLQLHVVSKQTTRPHTNKTTRRIVTKHNRLLSGRTSIPNQRDRVMSQVADMALCANKKDMLVNFNAFDDECTMVEHIPKINTEPCNLDEISAINNKQFINVARRKINGIMSKSSRRSSRDANLRYLDHRQKSEQELLSREYLSEMRRAKDYRLEVCKKIQQKYIDTYPEKVEERPFHLLTDIPQVDDNKVERNYTQVEYKIIKRTKKHKILDERTTFYSRSRNKLMKERYIPSHYKKMSAIYGRDLPSYIDYLTASRHQKQRIVNKNRKEDVDLSTMNKMKNKILAIEKAGSKGQERLQRCLNEILTKSVR